MADYYKLLGLMPHATPQQVWRAARRYKQRHLHTAQTFDSALFEKAVATLSNPRHREIYDRVHGFNQATDSPFKVLLQVAMLQQDLLKCRRQNERLEVAARRAQAEAVHAYSYHEEMTERRRERWQRIGWVGIGLLALLIPQLLSSLFSPSPSLEVMLGKPYQPVAEGFRWSANRDSLKQQQIEMMPQFRGGAAGLRIHVRDQLLLRLPIERVNYLLETAHGIFVVDSTGHVGNARIWGVADSTEARLLQHTLIRLPRFVPGFQEARPTAVRLALPLAK